MNGYIWVGLLGSETRGEVMEAQTVRALCPSSFPTPFASTANLPFFSPIPLCTWRDEPEVAWRPVGQECLLVAQEVLTLLAAWDMRGWGVVITAQCGNFLKMENPNLLFLSKSNLMHDLIVELLRHCEL